MFTLSEISAVKTFLEVMSKIRGAYVSLKATSSKKVDLQDSIEKYFAFEGLPNNKIRLVGKLSNYTITTNFPVYTPRGLNSARVENIGVGQKGRIEFRTMALNVPAIVHNPIMLEDNSKAKIFWLYPPENTGLVFPTKAVDRKNPLAFNNLSNLFAINSYDRPIPVLADSNIAIDEFLYTTVELTGNFVTAPLKHFEELSKSLNPFFLNYYSNCIRPFSNVDGVLAIDIRNPNGKIEKIDNKRKSFKIIYSIQSLISIPENANVSNALILAACIDGIPDRQGIPREIKSITDGSLEKINTIITIGEISWQYSENLNSIAAFIEIDVSDSYDSQTKVAKLTHHWSSFQKKAMEIVSNNYGITINIQPLVCSNNIHKNNFHPNGLIIPKEIESAIFNESPIIRNGIDWLGISVGR
jgi:hypothetical protein